jgi:hypothetical protein
MERNTARRAADVLTDLLKAHVEEGSEHVDVHKAMAVRDDLREIAEESHEWNIPEEGDVLLDPESNPRFGDGRVRVTEVLGTQAKTTYFDSRTGKRSVAFANPGHPDDAPVVKGTYVDGNDKEYHFPVTRLKET